ncbi:glycosyltransferase family 2 protein [Rhodovibrionaceae bacterium A322]
MIGHLDPIFDRFVSGWAVNEDDFRDRYTMVLKVDNVVQAEFEAENFREDLKQYGDGNFAFHWVIPDSFADGEKHELTVEIDGGEEIMGSPQTFRLLSDQEKAPVFVPESERKTKTHHITIGAIVKNEAPYLIEWLAFHRVMGIERFVIYDNGSDDGSSDFLEKLDRQGVITHVPFPDADCGNSPIQAVAYRSLFTHHGKDTDWLIFLDPDEFIVPRKDDNIPDLLDRYEDVPALSLYWRLFGSDGKQEMGDRLVMERFQRCSLKNNAVNRLVKTFFRPDYLESIRVHIPFLIEGTVVDEQRVPLDPHQGGCGLHPSFEFASINHYFTKSREEWMRKRAKGRVDLPTGKNRVIRMESDFALHDCNDTEDPRILDFLQATKAEMHKLEKLIGEAELLS